MFFLAPRHTEDGVFYDLPKIFDHFPKISAKTCPKVTRTLPNIFRKIFEDFRRCAKITEDCRRQEIIKVREWIPNIGPISKVIPQVIFRHCTEFFRGYYSRAAWMFISFRFVSKQRKTSNAVGMSSLIFWLQARELRLSVCFNTFGNFNRSLNKRRMSSAPWTITTE